MSQTNVCRIASGVIYLQNLTQNAISPCPFLPIGNAQAELAVEQDTQELPDYTNVAGGNACSLTTVKAVKAKLTLSAFSPANFARAVAGTVTDVATASVTNEPIKVFAPTSGAVVKLARLPRTSVALGQLTVGSTNYTVGTDFRLVGGKMIEVIAGSALETAILADTNDPPYLNAVIDYTAENESVVQALTAASDVYSAVIQCRNRTNSGAYEVWELFQFTITPTTGLALISTSFSTMEVNLNLVADTTKGVGESQYFKVTQKQ